MTVYKFVLRILSSNNPKNDLGVIGGGASGICTAVVATRNGAKTVLVQERSVLGGSALSEIRVLHNVVNHLKNGLKETETGIVEEIWLLDRTDNPQAWFPVFDHLIYEFIIQKANL